MQDVTCFVDIMDFDFEDVRMGFAPVSENAPPSRTSSAMRELVGHRPRLQYQGTNFETGETSEHFTDWAAVTEDWEFGMLPVDSDLTPVFRFEARDSGGNVSATESFRVGVSAGDEQ